MQRMTVTVKRSDESRGRDLELPGEVEAQRLELLIARALHWDHDPAGQVVRYQIEAQPLGRLLQPDENLAEAGVWDGASLVLHPVGRHPPPVPPAQTGGTLRSASGGPVEVWQPLGIALPAPGDPSTPPPDDQAAGGFVWKRLDE